MTPNKTYNFLNKIMNFDTVSLTRRIGFVGLIAMQAALTWWAVASRRAEQSLGKNSAISSCDQRELSPLLIKLLENSELRNRVLRGPISTLKVLAPRVKMQASHLSGLRDLGLTDYQVKAFLDAEIKMHLREAPSEEFAMFVAAHKKNSSQVMTDQQCSWTQAHSDFVSSQNTAMLERCYSQTQWSLVKAQLGCL